MKKFPFFFTIGFFSTGQTAEIVLKKATTNAKCNCIFATLQLVFLYKVLHLLDFIIPFAILHYFIISKCMSLSLYGSINQLFIQEAFLSKYELTNRPYKIALFNKYLLVYIHTLPFEIVPFHIPFYFIQTFPFFVYCIRSLYKMKLQCSGN